MQAAVVRSFDRPPRYESFDGLVPSGDNEVVVEVLAAGLHPRVRSAASGQHYTTTGDLPLVPGVDGVGRLPDGTRVYFLALDSRYGSMADRTAADRRRCIEVPEGVDDATVAAAMNPAMSSWVGLRARASFQPGQSVVVVGATGNAGQMAVQIAKRLGASRVVGVGRDRARLDSLASLGADAVVSLEGAPAQVAARLAETAVDADVVIDYLWGAPAELALPAILAGRSSPDQPLTWIQIGAVAGPAISLPSALLRSHNLRVIGSGQGSVSVRDILAELPALLDELVGGGLTVHARPVPLRDVEAVWDAPTAAGERIVFIPATKP
jgi:NADPH:quinone reductase-like Zn-dependent oxidoreductase